MTPEQKAEVMGIAQEMIALEQAPGWRHFIKAAEQFALSNTPRITTVNGQEHAIEIASKMAYVSGVRACLGLIGQQKEILKSLTK